MALTPESRRGADGGEVRWEHMFDKTVTLSDVGKLNRLVVPKLMAERHFLRPLLASGGAVGAVLRFEDARGGGKAWALRFSFWGGSQSYVMTKGWSAFVRDRRLAAGDTVSFYRAGARLFIDCRRRGGTTVTAVVQEPVNETRRLVTSTTPATAVVRCVRLFGVDLELAGAEPPLDLQIPRIR